MKLSKMTLLVVGLSLAAGSTVMAQSWGRGGDDKDQEQKVKLLGTIPIPGPKPFASTDIRTMAGGCPLRTDGGTKLWIVTVQRPLGTGMA